MGRLKIILIMLLIFLSFHSFPSSPDEILKKNIQAVGGNEKLSNISNLSLRASGLIFFASKDGKMKIVKGKTPVCLEVLIVDKESVRKNDIRGIKEVAEAEKLSNIFQAKLFSGIFTVSGFGRELQYNGTKNFGIKKFHELATKIGEAIVYLYVDEEDFLIKRAVISYLSPEKEKQEINYDFGSYFENEGVKTPSSWFVSRVGGRGILYEVEEIKFNEELPSQFFTDISINIGNVKISSGEVKGNLLDFYERQGRFFILTNWTEECFEKAGIGNGDNVNLRISEKDFEFYFYKDINEARKAGTFQKSNILSKTLESEFYTLFFTEPIELKESLQVLMPIELKKK